MSHRVVHRRDQTDRRTGHKAPRLHTGVDDVANKTKAGWLKGDAFALFPLEWAKNTALCQKTRVLIAIVKHADSSTGTSFPSYKTISALTGIPQKKIGAIVKKLEEAGFLQRISRGNYDHTLPSSGKSTVYKVVSQPVAKEVPDKGDPQKREGRPPNEGLGRPRNGGLGDPEMGAIRDHEETIGIDQLIDQDSEALVSLADDDSAQVADRVIEPESQLTACGLEVFSVLDDDGPHKRGSLHSHSSSAQQPHHVATNNTSDSYGDDAKPNWSNGVDSFDDPSEYRTAEDSPPTSTPQVIDAKDLFKRMLNQQ